ncbi:MAG: DUF2809 domain-containing protein [Ferruginibacter sp.]|nr:DUF2809 domain-containing protein [Ferruginibacter sp.]
MFKIRLTYALLFIFCTWLALATRSHHQWFHPLIVKYGGDIIWSGMFLFLLRIFFVNAPLWKLALINYTLGVLDECSQLSDAGWIVAIRQTYFGGLLFGVGFVWSDLICYAIGTLMAWGVVVSVERLMRVTINKNYHPVRMI